MSARAFTRREFLAAGGALVVSFSLSPRAMAQAGEEATRSARAKLPGSLDSFPMLDSWIRIGADGRVTVLTGKGELGQGIRTALQRDNVGIQSLCLTHIVDDVDESEAGFRFQAVEASLAHFSDGVSRGDQIERRQKNSHSSSRHAGALQKQNRDQENQADVQVRRE